MVKIITTHIKFIALFKAAATKINRLSKKQLVAVGILSVLTLTVFIFAVASKVNESHKSAISCQALSSQSSQTLKSAGNDHDIINLNQKLETNSGACSSQKSLLSNSSLDEKLSQLQFYHDKATTNYMLGKFDEAKKDAAQGLAINGKLKDSEKKLPKHDHIVIDLENVRDGKY